MSEALVLVSQVSKTFGEQRALDRVSLTIDRGEVHALVGENGSGKSTLIKILSGYHRPDDGGGITVGDTVLAPGSPAESHRLGMRFVHQNLGLVNELDAVDNLGLAAGFATGPLWTVRRREQERRTRHLLDRIGVDIDLGQPVGALRPVERSALAIARALDDSAGDIRLLVLDEPTAALPPAEVEALFRVVRDVVARGVSVLYVSHRLDEILALADRVSVLRDGAFRGTFPARELSRDDVVEHILGHPADAGPGRPGLAAAATASGAAEEIRPALRVRDFRTTFLRAISFDVRPGEIVGVGGLDGSGREELAAALGGAVAAEGQLIDGEGVPIPALTPRQLRRHGVALVLPNWHRASAVREFDLRENISLATMTRDARFGIVDARAEMARATEWLRAVDVRPPVPDRIFSTLSGGNQQKVIVARWLAASPTVLVLDDPTSGVDIGARWQIYELVRAQAARGLGVVLCSSDLEDLVELCSRVVCLVGGSIAAEVTGADITESTLLRSITATGVAVPAGTTSTTATASRRPTGILPDAERTR